MIWIQQVSLDEPNTATDRSSESCELDLSKPLSCLLELHHHHHQCLGFIISLIQWPEVTYFFLVELSGQLQQVVVMSSSI